VTSKRSRSNRIQAAVLGNNTVDNRPVTVTAGPAKTLEEFTQAVAALRGFRAPQPAPFSPYLDFKHICAYDGPTKGCRCESS
jgi:hypothetical protein